MYATPGNHPYVLPFGMLKDVTDRGPLWDPSLNTYSYFYDYVADREDKDAAREPTSLTPTASNPERPYLVVSLRRLGGRRDIRVTR